MRKPWAAILAAIVCMFAFCATALAQDSGGAEPTVSIRTDKTSLSVGESLRLVITVKNAEDATADLAPLMDFQVLSEEKGASLTLEDKNVTSSVALTYGLAPLKLGRLVIPALTVKAGGASLATRPLTVTVTAEAPSESGAKGERQVFLETETTRAKPFVGEEFLYKTRIYRSVPLASASLRDPDFAGFAAKRVPGQRDYETLVGKTSYMVSEVTYLLTPITAGERVVKGATLQCEIVREQPGARSRSPLPFYFGSELESKVLSAPPATITARALPPYSGKAGYSGLIGAFTLSAEASQTEMPTGGSTTVTLTISGKGNIMDAPQLPVPAPDAAKIYDDAPETKADLTDTGYQGKSVQRHSLVAVRPGPFTLGPFSLVYFDPQKESYETARSGTLAFTATPGKGEGDGQEGGKAGEGGSGPSGKPKVAVEPAPKESVQSGAVPENSSPGGLTPLYRELDALDGQAPMSGWLFAMLLALPPIIYFGAVFWERKRRPVEGGPAGRMAARALATIEEARQASGADVCALCARALAAAALSRACRESESLTYEEFEATLVETGLDAAEASRLGGLFRRLDAARFGDSSERPGDLLDQTAAAVGRLLS